MVAQSLCPDPEMIHDLLCGDLPESALDELASHLEVCSECRELFDSQASGPEFLGDAARLTVGTAWERETAALRQLVEDLPQQLSQASDAASMALWSAETIAEFLEPSENPEHLGRLGAYEVVEVIGRGGMGVVLRGIDERLNRTVAIKTLAPAFASNANARRRFAREARAAAAVSHDHVVTIHAVDETGSLPYLVMEFVSGESLAECIRREGTLTLEATLRIGRQMALGLAAAHEVGLAHRDMTPANILLENGIQRVRITDFGLARAADDVAITQPGVVTGTPLYMSPEQAAGESIDHRSDLFSLGSILYTMCTGRPAFRANSTLAVLKRVCEDTPRPIREVNPDCPQWLVEIVGRLMAKRPEDRLQTAAEVAELLGGHLAHLQDPQKPAPGSVAVAPETKAKTMLKPLLAALLVLVSAVGISEAAGVTHLVEYLGIILRLETRDGTLVVEIEDPDVTVSVDDGEVVVEGAGVREIRLKPGRHKWTTRRSGTPASTQWVTVERGGKKILRVRQLPPATTQASAKTRGGAEASGRGAEPEATRPETARRVERGPIGQPETITIGEPGEELTRLTAYDGIVFQLPQHVRRFYTGQHVHGPDEEHVFHEVPDQLWGQRCTSGYRDGGTLRFSVHDSRISGRQRLWLLVCNSDWSKGEGFESPASLQEKGWVAWRQLISSPITDRNQSQKTEWTVFYRDAVPGESHEITTHSRRTPLLVWGCIDLDGVLCEPHWDQRIGTFGPNATVPLGNGHHVFEGPIPETLIGRRYTKRNGYLGISRFRVERTQTVIVGMYDWAQMNNSGSGGPWQEELTSPLDMKKNGWKEIAQLQAVHSNGNPEYRNTWYFYSRDCQAGETFALRNHKYQAPIVLAEPGNRRGPAQEPVPALSNSEPLTDGPEPGPGRLLREKPENIRLPVTDIAFELAPQTGERAGLYGCSSTVSGNLSQLYGQATEGRQQHAPSPSALVGQLVGLPPESRFKVTSVTRRASRVQIIFELIPPNSADWSTATSSEPGASSRNERSVRATSLYFHWPLPPLPSGRYDVEAIVLGKLFHQTEGEIVTALSTATDSFHVAHRVSDRLKEMAIQAIVMKPDGGLGLPQKQATTGFDLTELLAADPRQYAALKGFPQKNSEWESACERLRSERKAWALCELLNWDNVDRRIYAARSLRKLAEASTVPILLAAAKRNAYAISGSENATLHLIYRTELARALESAARRNHLPGDEQPTLLSGEPSESVDFRRVENWLRTVYLADAHALQAAARPPLEDGLTGRATGDGKDTGVIFRYANGRFFHRNQVPAEVLDHDRFQITLEGFVDVPRDMTVKVWLAGGGVSHDVNWLYVNGKEVGSTGDDRGKNYTYDVPLLKGRHKVRWLLTGGTFTNNILVFLDPQSGELLPLKSRGVAAIRRSEDEPLIEINGTEMGWPIRENWLPDVVYRLAGEEKQALPAPPAKGGF